MPRLSTRQKLARSTEKLDRLHEQDKKNRALVKRKSRAAMKAIDRATSHALEALTEARAALAMASAMEEAPAAPGSDVWLSSEQTCMVLGNISYQWLKQLEQDGKIPRSVQLEGRGVRHYFRLSWCLAYLEDRYQEDPIAFASALLQRARRSAEKKNKAAAGIREVEEKELGVMQLTGSEVF